MPLSEAFFVHYKRYLIMDRRGHRDRRDLPSKRGPRERDNYSAPRDEALVIYGRHPVLEALRKGIVQEIEIHQAAHGAVIKEIEQEAAQHGIRCYRRTFESDTDSATRQGVRARINPVTARDDLPDFVDELDLSAGPLLLMLDGIEDPHNFGAILRSAYAAGVDGVIVRSRRQAPLTSTVFKTSAGAAALIPIFEVNNLEHVLRSFKPMGWWVASAVMNDSTTDYRDYDWNLPTILIMGAEGKGVSDLLVKRSDHLISIPMRGKLDSLNVSVATGILLFEASHQKLTKKGK